MQMTLKWWGLGGLVGAACAGAWQLAESLRSAAVVRALDSIGRGRGPPQGYPRGGPEGPPPLSLEALAYPSCLDLKLRLNSLVVAAQERLLSSLDGAPQGPPPRGPRAFAAAKGTAVCCSGSSSNCSRGRSWGCCPRCRSSSPHWKEQRGRSANNSSSSRSTSSETSSQLSSMQVAAGTAAATETAAAADITSNRKSPPAAATAAAATAAAPTAAAEATPAAAAAAAAANHRQ
ncbi:hypothetical protein Efla_002809 [Eimeria flavescens]